MGDGSPRARVLTGSGSSGWLSPVVGLLGVVGLVVATAGCGDEPADVESIDAERCIVRLHGKSETGAAPTMVDGVGEISPTGNGRAGDGHEWVYFPDERYREALDIVSTAIVEAGCDRVVLGGFSNGAAFAAAVYCAGETFGDRLAGVVVDDPPPDEAVAGCDPSPGIEVALYWTGALDEMATPGASCDAIGWTCSGGRLLGIDAYASELGAEIQTSPYVEHVWYRSAPELTAWLGP